MGFYRSRLAGRLVSRSLSSLHGTGRDSALFYYPTRGAIGIDRRRRADVAWTFTDTSRIWPYAFEDRPVVAKGRDSLPSIYSFEDINWKWWKMRTAVGGGPVLIHDGKVHITNREEQLFPDAGGDYEITRAGIALEIGIGHASERDAAGDGVQRGLGRFGHVQGKANIVCQGVGSSQRQNCQRDG